MFKNFLLIAMLFAQLQTHAQVDTTHHVDVTFNKTTSVIFPASIKSVDRGSRDLLAQKAKGLENVLQLKAARENFPETNLTVITADGMLFHFTVRYARQPRDLTINFTHPTAPQPASLIFESDLTEADMQQHAQRIVKHNQKKFGARTRKSKITLSLQGIYIQDNVIYYHLQQQNKSNIHYDVSFCRFFIKDRSKVKRTASQEVDIKPLYSYGDHTRIKGQSKSDLVYALQKLTIPDAKQLIIEIFEHNGGRHLTLTIKNKAIVRAKPIPVS